MKNILVSLIVIFVCNSFIANCQIIKKREVRGVWIATVANIDWPSTRQDVSSQKQELISLLDSLHACRINTIYFQIRPTADAFYHSDLEPWSIYLTGKQGVPPQEQFDPLSFFIEEAHRRCIDAHAWINPYRVTNGESEDKLAPNHIYFQRPNLFLKYGGKIYFNPGLQEVRDYLASVVMDIVLRYDIDGIHLDDYFYPYKVANADFPDLETFRENHRGIYDRREWRRDNVNLIVEQLSRSVKAAKPWVSFGVSPFGIWRNDTDDIRGSHTVTSCTNYDELSADVLHWLCKGWIDYVAPQLYWEIGKSNLDFCMLTDWWRKSTYGRNLYLGLYASGLAIKSEPAWKNPNEVCRQIKASQHLENVDGYVFYSAKYLKNNIQGLADSLRNRYFKYPALPMANTLCPASSPSAPPKNVKLQEEGDTMRIAWANVEKKGGHAISYYAVYMFRQDELLLPDAEHILTLTPNTSINLSDFSIEKGSYYIYITNINRFKQESKLSKFVKAVVR